MGACLSLCGGADDGEIYKKEQSTKRPSSSYPRAPDTEADRNARAAAAEAAAARASQFENSAAGRAAIKSVKAVREERASGAASSRANDNAADWLN